ncbi:MAG: 6-phosphofructokinase, partial [Elusimicrobia bacterium]|nr:6-phosphofructokinase [Elusimicrobiota bacterium]
MATLQSELQLERSKFKPALPAVLRSGPTGVVPRLGKPTQSVSDQDSLRAIFPKTYGLPLALLTKGRNPSVGKKPFRLGIVFSGGQAPGGHNVLAGLFDALKKANPKNKLIGFIGGPSGILENKRMDITAAVVDNYRNTGGFDMIQSGRTKIETPEQLATAKKTIEQTTQANRLDGLAVVGGDDSNTNAALLSEYFKNEGVK